MKSSKPVSQYLSRHAEPEAAAADALPGDFGHVLVVPAYGEGQSLFDTLGSVPRGPRGDTLIVVVLNAREDSPPGVHEANDAARARLIEAAASESGSSEATTRRPASKYPNGAVLLVDRAAARTLPPGGPGRRPRAQDRQRRRAAPPRRRPRSPRLDPQHRRRHDPAPTTTSTRPSRSRRTGTPRPSTSSSTASARRKTSVSPARLYEISLRYYTLGPGVGGLAVRLRGDGQLPRHAPRAPTPRSAGFPRKNAAEDFYILDKLAKVGIDRAPGGSSASSGRADLGPRPVRNREGALGARHEEARPRPAFRLLPPRGLRPPRRVAARSSDDRATRRAGWTSPSSELPRGNPFFLSDVLLGSLEKHGRLRGDARGRSSARATRPTMLRHFHTWFDAFRTLKLVHALRDGGLPSLPWRQALAEAPFTGLSASTEEAVEPLRRPSRPRSGGWRRRPRASG